MASMEAAAAAAADDAYPFSLGHFHRPGASTDAEAQRWFDRGMVWMFAFHHEEAIWCMLRALERDPSCVLAHWAVAFAHGPDYNVNIGNYYPGLCPTDGYPSMQAAVEHAAMAVQLAAQQQLPPVVQALVDALPCRYAWPVPEGGADALMRLNEAFADRMRAVHHQFPEDPDVATFFAEALMNLTPWQMYDGATFTPAPHADEVRTALDAALAVDPAHLGANHFMVHLLEMSLQPEDALPACRALLAPDSAAQDAPHLLHMPSHIYALLGMFGEAVESNARAVEANTKLYTADRGGVGQRAGTDFYIGYVAHDYHMLVYSAMLGGAEAKAREYVERLNAVLPDDLVAQEGLAPGVEAFRSLLPHVLVRFGRWEEILTVPLPADPDLFVSSAAVLRYARAVALAALGRVDEAQVEENLLLEAIQRISPGPNGQDAEMVRVLHNNNMADVLAVAAMVVRGELLYRQARLVQQGGVDAAVTFEDAYGALREAVALEDALHYDEPWGWMVPVRHALGGLLLEQGRCDEAAAVFRSDLTGVTTDASGASTLPRHNRHPNNVWSLVGLRDSLAQGAQAADAATESPEAMTQRVQAALSDCRADVVVHASCGCVMTKPRPVAAGR